MAGGALSGFVQTTTAPFAYRKEARITEARKKAQQQSHKGNFNPKDGTKGKVNSKGFGGPAVTRKTGRGS